jgi:hypothetical protein
MKKALLILIAFAFLFTSCDKVKNAYVPSESIGLDTTLFPGLWSTYPAPVFTANTNTLRNILIEDFTGHKCTFCPDAALVAHTLEENNPDRVFISTIHSGPLGTKSGFQKTYPGTEFDYDFTNPVGLAIGAYFGSLPGSNFFANPCGNISRVAYNGHISNPKEDWTSACDALIAANELKVNLQSVVNYFDATKGAFVHVEVDVLDPAITGLAMIVGYYQDSIVKPQAKPAGVEDLNYVHRDLLKEHINGGMFGQDITDKQLDATSGKYYFDYSYRIPDEYPAENGHFLIYVVDKVSLEIYQVIKKPVL